MIACSGELERLERLCGRSVCDTPERRIAEHSAYQRQGVGDERMGIDYTHCCRRAFSVSYGVISLGLRGSLSVETVA